MDVVASKTVARVTAVAATLVGMGPTGRPREDELLDGLLEALASTTSVPEAAALVLRVCDALCWHALLDAGDTNRFSLVASAACEVAALLASWQRSTT